MLDYATDLRYPNFAKMAEAAGVLGLKANAPEQVRPLLAQALNHPGAALVEVCSRPPGTRAAAVDSVSYTHLDVYKRQTTKIGKNYCNQEET